MKRLSKITILLLMAGCGNDSSNNEGKSPSLDATTKEYINCNASASKLETPKGYIESCYELDVNNSTEELKSEFENRCSNYDVIGKGQCPRSNLSGFCLHSYEIGDVLEVYYPANNEEEARLDCIEFGGKWTPK